MAVKRIKGEGSIFQRSDGMWVGHYKGKRVYASTRSDIVTKFNQLKADVDAGFEKLKNPTISDYAQLFLASKEISLKPQSYYRLLSTYKTQIEPRVGNIRLQDFTTNHLTTLIIKPMMNEGLSYSSVKKAYDYMHSMFNHALNTRDVKFNPIIDTAKPRKENFECKTVDEESDAVFFTTDELKAFTQECGRKYNNNAPVYPTAPAFIFILNTGIRTGEMLGLPWSMVDFEKKQVTIKYNVIYAAKNGKKTYIQSPYTKKSRVRVLPLNTAAIRALLDLKQWQYEHGIESDYVVCNKSGDLVRVQTFIRTFTTICEHANIPTYKNHKIHALRHTFASSLFKRGVDVKIVSSLLGHSSVQITMDIYIHLIEEQNLQAVMLIDDIT